MKTILPSILIMFLFADFSLAEEISSIQATESKAPAEKKEVWFTSCRTTEKSTDGVKELEGLVDGKPVFDIKGDACFQITPKSIKENSDYRIFKYDRSSASYVLYKGKAHQLGNSFGGSGLDSVQLADLNNDGINELYFTCSWGSGIGRGNVGYFDPVKEEVTVFDYARPHHYFEGKLVEGDGIYLHEIKSMKDGEISTLSQPEAKIFFSEGKVQLTPLSGEK